MDRRKRASERSEAWRGRLTWCLVTLVVVGATSACSDASGPLAVDDATTALASADGGVATLAGERDGLCAEHKYVHHVRQIVKSGKSEAEQLEEINKLHAKCGRDALPTGTSVWVYEAGANKVIPRAERCASGWCVATSDRMAAWYFPDGWSAVDRVVTSARWNGPLATEREQGGYYGHHAWVPAFPAVAGREPVLEHCEANGFHEPRLAGASSVLDPAHVPAFSSTGALQLACGAAAATADARIAGSGTFGVGGRVPSAGDYGVVELGPPPVADRDGDGVPDSADVCPDESGSAATRGCPDGDGDGTPDSDDLCPADPGAAAMGGCPDGDGDGVPDARDDCPAEPGLAALGGCPDGDNDGTRDADDACPADAGPAAMNGCPDGDGDGIPDVRDECPAQPGSAAMAGCPDGDGDGVADNQDGCPLQPGPAALGGCPDSDADGTPDVRDDCPAQPGPAAMGGCPDSDGDGIPDNLDGCPLQAGPPGTGGCPDADGDGIWDGRDDCPAQPGPPGTRGCRDSDSDGVPDILDGCPLEAGSVATGGCPDSDGDGVSDRDDRCPTEPGLPWNRGCPAPA